jgi:hypothetical protein
MLTKPSAERQASFFWGPSRRPETPSCSPPLPASSYRPYVTTYVRARPATARRSSRRDRRPGSTPSEHNHGVADDAGTIHDIIERLMRVSVDPQRDWRSHQITEIAGEARIEVRPVVPGMNAASMRQVMSDHDRRIHEFFDRRGCESSSGAVLPEHRPLAPLRLEFHGHQIPWAGDFV